LNFGHLFFLKKSYLSLNSDYTYKFGTTAPA
jgi:hypothetical protein